MARRTVLTSRQRSALFALPQREADLLRHYTLSDEDLQNIGAKRRPRNKLGFALQLCVLRYPGRLLVPGDRVRSAADGRGFPRPGTSILLTAPPVRIPVLLGRRGTRARRPAPRRSATGAVERGSGPQVRRGVPSHANHPAGHDDDRAALRRRAGRRGTPDRSPHRRAGPARASARP